MSDPQDDRCLRYCIARLSAYWTVWWSLANEFDFMTDGPKSHRGNKQMEDWDRFFRILQQEDPHSWQMCRAWSVAYKRDLRSDNLGERK